jgi:hypothetical protein
MMPILDDVQEEALRIIDQAQQWGISLRLIGGLAIKLHSPSASHRALERHYPDMDFVASKHGKDKLPDLLISLGYEPNKTFNTLSGDRRQLYYDHERDRQIDIFIENFEMCHKLPLGERLDVESITIPLAELFLTKAQIVEMNEKDIRDICALLLDHEVGPGDEEMFNSTRIAELCARDWGLWKTVSLTINKVRGFLDRFSLKPSEAERIGSRLEAIKKAIDDVPKSMAWRMRDRVGTRVRWYELPEEVQRT